MALVVNFILLYLTFQKISLILKRWRYLLILIVFLSFIIFFFNFYINIFIMNIFRIFLFNNIPDVSYNCIYNISFMILKKCFE